MKTPGIVREILQANTIGRLLHLRGTARRIGVPIRNLAVHQQAIRVFRSPVLLHRVRKAGDLDGCSPILAPTNLEQLLNTSFQPYSYRVLEILSLIHI